jgi:hypothetical protein
MVDGSRLSTLEIEKSTCELDQQGCDVADAHSGDHHALYEGGNSMN